MDRRDLLPPWSFYMESMPSFLSSNDELDARMGLLAVQHAHERIEEVVNYLDEKQIEAGETAQSLTAALEGMFTVPADYTSTTDLLTQLAARDRDEVTAALSDQERKLEDHRITRSQRIEWAMRGTVHTSSTNNRQAPAQGAQNRNGARQGNQGNRQGNQGNQGNQRRQSPGQANRRSPNREAPRGGRRSNSRNNNNAPALDPPTEGRI
jgi:hypothetical protein